ncbi:hypothetical protein CEXT_334791 [Caerostris extrusa]|uniref:Uncharacterized protein n=1 Tax=Caerostris extrusa TaxID=172846 RepID=A0AAV4SG53_CAEEX|nr:hypothetical protein CEXT_334791 [Caerostris extrusa]
MAIIGVELSCSFWKPSALPTKAGRNQDSTGKCAKKPLLEMQCRLRNDCSSLADFCIHSLEDQVCSLIPLVLSGLSSGETK